MGKGDRMLLQVGSSDEGQEGEKGMWMMMRLHGVVKWHYQDGSRFSRTLFAAYQHDGLGD